MRQLGIRVQVEKAEILQKEMLNQEKEILLAIKKESGIEVDIWASRQIARAFDKMKLDYPRTEKTKEPSFTQNWLSNNKNKIAQLIVQAREVNKFHGTFLSSIGSIKLTVEFMERYSNLDLTQEAQFQAD